MVPLQINVQINLGADSSLIELVKTIANLHTDNTQNTKTTDAAPLADTNKTKTTAKHEAKNLSTEVAKEPAAEEKAEAAPEPVKEEPAPAKEEPKKEYTEVDVRAAMKRARARIEGEGGPDSDDYKKWHRPMTAWFKNTATLYGAEKPSAIADSESRAKFVKECDDVQVINGELTAPLPF